MYSTKLINKNLVENNKYITIGDPYRDPKANLFRQDKKGEKCLSVPVRVSLCLCLCLCLFLSFTLPVSPSLNS
jgi:hypothetical protein